MLHGLKPPTNANVLTQLNTLSFIAYHTVPIHKGLFVFIQFYCINQVVNSIAMVLGYSSLVNIPRVPIDLVKGTVGLGLTVADNLSSGLGTLLSNLTFDSEYINQRQRVRVHADPNMALSLARDTACFYVNLFRRIELRCIGRRQASKTVSMLPRKT